MKRILVFSTNYLPHIGGAELAIREITDRLGDTSFSLITARLKGSLPSYETMGRVSVYRVGFGFSVDKFLIPILGFFKAISLHRREKFDAVWCMMASQASVAAAFFKIAKRRVPLVLTLQEGDEEEHLRRYVFNIGILYRLLIKPWHILIFKVADLITVISKHLENRARQYAPTTPIELVPNGVDVAFFSDAASPAARLRLRRELAFAGTDFVVVTVSRLVQKNAVGDIIRAVSLLPSHCKLLIVGEGELESELRKLSAELGVIERVVFAGNIPPEKVPEYLAAADAFVRPSLSEGFGSAFIEAMAAGVPVIAAPVGGITDFLDDKETGLFCGVRDPKDVALKIGVLMQDRDLRASLIARAREMVVNKYDWAVIAKDMREKSFERLFRYVRPDRRISGMKKWVLAFCTFMVLCIFISPNPFGNIPDAIVDESYFLSSALSAIQKHTLPGWDFVASGAFYGGVQTYLVTAATSVAVAIIALLKLSFAETQLYVATHIGDLTHLVRLVNGGVVALGLIALMWWSARRKNAALEVRVWLLIFLLLGNSLFVSMAHTGKVWVLQAVFELAAAVLVLLRHYGFIKRGYLIALLVLSLAAVSQTITGVFTAVWILYAWYLRHFTGRELWRGIKIMIPVALIALVLQLSIFYRGFDIADRYNVSLTNISGTAFRAGYDYDFAKRILWPMQIAVESQPLAAVAFGGLLIYWLFKAREFISDRLRHVGAAHLFFVWAFFYGLLGQGGLTRYVLPLTIACTVSAVFLLPDVRSIKMPIIIVAALLAGFVSFHTLRLWWQPASEGLMTQLVVSDYNSPDIAIFVRTPVFSLPANVISLEHASETEKQFGRNRYLLQHKDELLSHETFRSLSIKWFSTTTPPFIPGFKNYEISVGCEWLCKTDEAALGSCRELNAEICSTPLREYAHEGPTIADMARSSMLGYPFIIRSLSQY